MGKLIIITPFSLFPNRILLKLSGLLILLVGLLSSCQQPATSAPTSSSTPSLHVVATKTFFPTRTQPPTAPMTPSPSVSLTTTRTPTITPTLAPLDMFTPPKLRPGVLSQSYIQDNCSYLQKRWSVKGSSPGTVVVPIMFHSIAQNGTQITDPKDITGEEFEAFVNYAHFLGSETITTQELIDFLENNTNIPQRSMIIIVAYRRPGLIREWIMPVLEQFDWTVTSAYIADPNSFHFAWDMMDQLYSSGRMEVQSHGYTGQLYVVPETPIEQIQNEIWNSTPVLEQHFGEQPIAFIWPGGNFTSESVRIAREGGYKLGFTAYSRGPVLFNSIPLGEDERVVNDPLMVIPRAWSSAVNVNLDEAVKVSEQAAEFAEKNFSTEAAWYRTYCAGEISNRP